MKNYLIWLESGACIEGEITEVEAGKLILAFTDPNSDKLIKEVKDSEGVLYIRLDNIESIAINNIPEENNNIGFKR